MLWQHYSLFGYLNLWMLFSLFDMKLRWSVKCKKKTHQHFGNKSDPNYCYRRWRLVFSSCPQESGWKVVLLLVPADSLCTCAPDVGLIPPAMSPLTRHTFPGHQGFFFSLFYVLAGCCWSGKCCARSGRRPAAVAGAGNVTCEQSLVKQRVMKPKRHWNANFLFAVTSQLSSRCCMGHHSPAREVLFLSFF